MPKTKFSLQLSFSLSFVVCSTVLKNNSDNLLKKLHKKLTNGAVHRHNTLFSYHNISKTAFSRNDSLTECCNESQRVLLAAVIKIQLLK